MALSAELEKLLQFVPEKEREAYRAKLVENEENGLRQQDYSRKQTELQKEREAFTSERQKHLDWYKSANQEYTEGMKGLKAAQEERAALEAKVAELEKLRSEGGPQGDFDPEDQDAIAKQISSLRSEATGWKDHASRLEGELSGIKKQIEDGQLVTQDRFQEGLESGGNRLGETIFEIFDLQQRHQQDFGEPLDRKALIAKAHESGGDLNRAYESLTAEKAKEKMRTEIEQEVQQRYEEKLRAANLPIDSGATAPTLGPLQQRLQGPPKDGDESSIPDDVPADGSGRLAAEAAKELRAEGKY